MSRRLTVIAALAVLTLAAPPLISAQEVITERQTLFLQGATAAGVELDMRYGRIVVAPASAAATTPTALDPDALLDAEFRFSNEDWRPEVDYEIDEGVGELKIEQSGAVDVDLDDLDDVATGDFGNTWDLRLNPTIPLDLEVDLTAGDAQLAVGGLTLGELEVDVEAGRAVVDLTGAWSRRPDKLKVETTGGQIVLRLPRDVGVRIDADAGILGDIDADDELLRVSGDYVNDAYGTTPITLDVEVDATAGQIVLELADPSPADA